ALAREGLCVGVRATCRLDGRGRCGRMRHARRALPRARRDVQHLATGAARGVAAVTPVGTPLWLAEGDVKSLLGLEDAIDVLADAYRGAMRGENETMRRAHVKSGDSILHAVGGVLGTAGLAGTKTWVYSPGGAAPLLVLFAIDDGHVAAVI